MLGALSYLTGNEQVVSGFAKAGYPQHLRIVFVSPAGYAIVLLIPGLALLKEWAYAGATSTWIMASLSAHVNGEQGLAGAARAPRTARNSHDEAAEPPAVRLNRTGLRRAARHL